MKSEQLRTYSYAHSLKVLHDKWLKKKEAITILNKLKKNKYCTTLRKRIENELKSIKTFLFCVDYEFLYDMHTEADKRVAITLYFSYKKNIKEHQQIIEILLNLGNSFLNHKQKYKLILNQIKKK